MPRMEGLWVKYRSRLGVVRSRMGHLAQEPRNRAGQIGFVLQGLVQASLLQDLQRRRLCGPLQVLVTSTLPLPRDGVALHLIDQALAAQTQQPGGLLLIVPGFLQGLGDHPLLHLDHRLLQGLQFDRLDRQAARGPGSRHALPKIVFLDHVLAGACRQPHHFIAQLPDVARPGSARPACASPPARTPWRRAPSRGSIPSGSDSPAAGFPRGFRAAAACERGSP